MPLLRGKLERGASSGIMVLLVKQVHLQNEVGAACAPAEGIEWSAVVSSEVKVLGEGWRAAHRLRRRGRAGTVGRAE